MGLPLLPDPPEPIVITGPDRRRHTLRWRLWRTPTGICVEVREQRRDGNEGYEFAVLGAHDADLNELIGQVRERARREIGRHYLQRDRHAGGWLLGDDDEVAGRITFDPDGGPVRVVIDGRELDWDEFGQVLASFEGWRFRLQLAERCDDLRPDARILPLTRPAADRRPSER